MATETILFPPSNRVVPGSRLLPTAPFPDAQKIASLVKSTVSPDSIVSEWISSFINLLSEVDTLATRLFLKESYWRDLLCMTWDFHTLQGPEDIITFVKSSSKDDQITKVSLDKSAAHKVPQVAAFGDLKVVQAFLNIETSNGRGEGLVRLTPDPNDGSSWKALTLFTTLQELKGYEEKIHTRRPTGLPDNSLENGGLNWKDRLLAQRNFERGREPTVLILGAGQGGLTVAARLKQLGLETLIIDQNPRIGDNWRNRYHQLVLHDSVWFDHMPYLHFPPNWPVFTPKDKLADWFEYYAGVLELNVWTGTTLKTSEWSEITRQWTVDLVRESNGNKETSD
ncbi:hypothetical protein N7G274_007260 [Stereocaulon virgatum]|uniref:Flavin-containing monooxygenase n=1 Tax=Stereocaulon virgatum TaxID=373712 RepID=A0ABR4A520_9LECA